MMDVAHATPLTIRSLRARAVNVPINPPLRTASGTIGTAPLVLIDLLTEEGVVGSGYVFCYTPAALVPVAALVANLEGLIQGDAVAPVALEQKLQKHFRLLGPQGLTGIATAGIDMAAWDALARAAGLPLARLLGGEVTTVPAYCSLRSMTARDAAREAAEAVDAGFGGVKVKIGHGAVQEDVDVVDAIRETARDAVVMVDYNQSLTIQEAVTRCCALDAKGLGWIEEPVRADDHAGCAAVARQVRTPIQTGENWWGPHDMAKSLAAGASDCAMLDVMKIGGVTGWLRAAALAEAAGVPVSSHLFPEISAHLLTVTPNCHWLECYAPVDLASPVLAQPLRIERGQAIVSSGPGTGVAWDEAAVRRFLAA